MKKADKALAVFYTILLPIQFDSLYGIYKNTNTERINREKIRKERSEYNWGSVSTTPLNDNINLVLDE